MDFRIWQPRHRHRACRGGRWLDKRRRRRARAAIAIHARDIPTLPVSSWPARRRFTACLPTRTDGEPAKKLIGAAKRLASGDIGSPCDQTALHAFGIPESALPPIDHLEIWPENWPIVEVFLAMDTQWHTGGMSGRPIGLRYSSLPVVLRALRVPSSEFPWVFAGLRTMERAALSILQNG